MEKNKENKLFKFTREQIREATKEFQKMDPKEAKKLLLSNPLAKIFMEDLSAGSNQKKDD